MSRIMLPLLLGALIGCAMTQEDVTLAANAISSPTVATIARDYPTYQPMSEIIMIDEGLSLRCDITTEQDYDKVRKAHGPHALHYIRVRMNGAAAQAFAASSPYPIGSVVVKEKFKDEDDAKHKNGVGAMIKRSPGYDPAHGDWEYLFFNDPAKLRSGKIESCVQCHRVAKKTDYVFGSWAKSRLR